MKIERVTPIYFSATGNTIRIVSTFTESLGIDDVRKFNLSIPEIREDFTDINFEKTDLLLIGTPVYTGEVPDFLIPALEELSGDGQPAVIITVNGNVGRGVALEQLKCLLEERGFKVIAAASFIGEHSYSKEENEIAPGRPNEEDLSRAKEFGKNISDKLESLDGFEKIEEIEIDLDKGFRSNIREMIPTPQYGIKKFIEKPVVDKKKCISCGACANNCPKGAIDKETLEIDEEKCIRCMACAKNCPNEARKIEFKYPGLVRTFFEFMKNDEPSEPTIYD